VDKMRIGEIELDPRNARKHNEKNIDAIAASLKMFGQQRPVVMLGRRVIAGNGTVLAAKKLGWDLISAVEYSGPKDLAAAFAVADNRTAELAEWDSVALLETVKSFDVPGFDSRDVAILEALVNGIDMSLSDIDPPKVKEQPRKACPHCGKDL